MSLVDDRIVLPLTKTRQAAHLLCQTVCAGRAHHRSCLIPDLARRELLLTGPDLTDVVLPDCRDEKCVACTGCAHACHRHHNRPTAVVPSTS